MVPFFERKGMAGIGSKKKPKHFSGYISLKKLKIPIVLDDDQTFSYYTRCKIKINAKSQQLCSIFQVHFLQHNKIVKIQLDNKFHILTKW